MILASPENSFKDRGEERESRNESCELKSKEKKKNKKKKRSKDDEETGEEVRENKTLVTSWQSESEDASDSIKLFARYKAQVSRTISYRTLIIVIGFSQRSASSVSVKQSTSPMSSLL